MKQRDHLLAQEERISGKAQSLLSQLSNNLRGKGWGSKMLVLKHYSAMKSVTLKINQTL